MKSKEKMSISSAWNALLCANDLPPSLKLSCLDIDGDPITIRRKFYIKSDLISFLLGDFRLWALVEEFREMFNGLELIDCGIDGFSTSNSNEEIYGENIQLKELRRIYLEDNPSNAMLPSHDLSGAIVDKVNEVFDGLFDDWIDDQFEMPYPDLVTKRYLVGIKLFEHLRRSFDDCEWQEIYVSAPVQNILNRTQFNLESIRKQ